MPSKTLEIKIRPAVFPDDHAAVADLFREYAATLGIDLAFQQFDDELANLHAPPGGRLLLAYAGATPAGCVALRPLNVRDCEMKRLYVRQAFRGSGIGGRLVRELLESARDAGYSRILLDTLPSMKEAIALYESFGFRDIDPYCHNPVPGARFLAMNLKCGAALPPTAEPRPVPVNLREKFTRFTDYWSPKIVGELNESAFATFVVDKAGRIAFVGGPMFLDLVLPKVVAGNASDKAIGDEMAKVDAEYRAVWATLERDPAAGMRALEEFESNYPPLADLLPVVAVKLTELPKRGKPREARLYAEAMVAEAVKQKDVVLLEFVSSYLRNNRSDSKELLALAVKAAEERVRLEGGREPQSLLDLAEVYLVSGDKAKASESARRAIVVAGNESPALRQHIEEEARRIEFAP
ncbi:MAG TPA: GNAT family N-acetyltransferase [Pirellulales bacterium]|nr:GNAT family N-acetyltransferase [Pirellulales bacterium]